MSVSSILFVFSMLFGVSVALNVISFVLFREGKEMRLGSLKKISKLRKDLNRSNKANASKRRSLRNLHKKFMLRQRALAMSGFQDVVRETEKLQYSDVQSIAKGK